MKEFLKYLLNSLALSFVGWAVPGSLSTPTARQQNRCVVVRSDNLGDLILFLPALETLYKAAGETGVTLVVSEAAAELALGLPERGFPRLEVLTVDRHRFNANFFYKLSFLRQLRQRGFRQAIAPAFSRDSIADTLVAASGAAQRLGWRRQVGLLPRGISRRYDSGYTSLQASPASVEREAERNALLPALFCNVTREIPSLYFPLCEKDRTVAAELLARLGLLPGKFAILAPGAGSPHRIWPLERFAAVADYLSQKGLSVAVCGTASEGSLFQEIKRHARTEISDLCGQVDVFVLGAMLEQTALCVGNESGPIHIASAVGCPAVCIMGGGHQGRFFPPADSQKQIAVFDAAAPCLHDNWACLRGLSSGETAPCLRSVPVTAVTAAIDRVLAA